MHSVSAMVAVLAVLLIGPCGASLSEGSTAADELEEYLNGRDITTLEESFARGIFPKFLWGKKIQPLIEALAKIDLKTFGYCDSENLNGLRELVDAWRARNRQPFIRSSPLLLTSILAHYIEEVKQINCFSRLVPEWRRSGEVFEEIYGNNLALLDRLLVNQDPVDQADHRPKEVRMLEQALNMVEENKKNGRSVASLFSSNQLKELMKSISVDYKGPQKDQVDLSPMGVVKTINWHLVRACQRMFDRADTFAVLRPIVDLASVIGLDEETFEGDWYNEGPDSGQVFTWAARLAICGRIAEADPEELAKLYLSDSL